MIDFIKNKVEFERCKERFYTLFSQANFEENPFKSQFKYFLGFEFDFIYHELFFEGLKVFLNKIGSEKVCFYTIKPSPEKYFYYRFEKYSVFEIGVSATDSDLNHIMMKDPGGNSGNAIAITSDEISWFSDSNDWAILGSRDWEIAIVGFTNLDVRQKFIKSFSEDAQTMFTSIKTQADILNDMLRFNKVVKEKYQKLVENYRDRAIL